MSFEYMSRQDIAVLACASLHWINVLITLAKQNREHADTLLDIAAYLSDAQCIDFDEMAATLKT